MNCILVIPPTPGPAAGPLGPPLLHRSCFEHLLDVLAAAGVQKCWLRASGREADAAPLLEAAGRAGMDAAWMPEHDAADAAGREAWVIADAGIYLASRSAQSLREASPAGVLAVLADRHPTEPYTERVAACDGRLREIQRVYGDSPSDAARAAAGAGLYVVADDLVRQRGIGPILAAIIGRNLPQCDGIPVEVLHLPGAYRVIRDPWDCLAANLHALRYETHLLGHPYAETMPGVWTAPDVTIAPDSEIYGPVLLGPGVSIGPGACIVGPASIGPDCVVGAGAHIRDSLLMAGAKAGPDCRLRDSILGLGQTAEAGAELDRTAMIAGRSTTAGARSEPCSYHVSTILQPSDGRMTSLQYWGYRFAKRAIDITGSLFALAVTVPLYPAIALAIKIDSKGAVFFGHTRQTLGGRPFPCWKFRTMCANADELKARMTQENEADGPQFLIRDDPRMTRVGRLLRKANLDEVPQFWNVLLGHMSLVGPRPSPDKENTFCPLWRRGRLSVRPGITGLWQISRQRNPEEGDFHEWIQYDLAYVRNQSLREDMRIMFRTLVPEPDQAPEGLGGEKIYSWQFASAGPSPVAPELTEAVHRVPVADAAGTPAHPGMSFETGSFLMHGLRLVRNIILARVLAPGDFGLMAAVLAIIQGLEAVTDIGTHRMAREIDDGDSREMLTAAWGLSAVRAVLLCVLGFFAAPLLAGVFGAPALTDLLRASLLAVLFNGLISPRMHLLHRERAHGRWYPLALGPAAIAGAVALMLAGRIGADPALRVWVLVAALVAEGAAAAVLSFMAAPFLPSFAVSGAHLKRIAGFVRGSIGRQVPSFVLSNADVLAVALCLPPAQAGVYYLVRMLAVTFAVFFTRAILPGLLPGLAGGRDDLAALRSSLLRVTGLTMVLAMPLAAFGPAFSGETLVSTFGPMLWKDVFPTHLALLPSSVFCLLLLAMLLHVLLRIIGQVYVALGRVAEYRRFVWVKAAALAVCIIPVVRGYGLQGAAHAVLLVEFIAMLYQINNMGKVIDLDGQEYAARLFPGMACSLLLMVFVGAAVSLRLRGSPGECIVAGLLLCVAAWSAGLVWLSAARPDSEGTYVRPQDAATAEVPADALSTPLPEGTGGRST